MAPEAVLVLRDRHHGRPTKGMPPWSGALRGETIWKIYTFLESVQSAPE